MSQTSTDPIADMLTRIRNSIAVNKPEVTLPYSKIKEAIAKILAESRYISELKVEGENTNKVIRLKLTYEGQNSKITAIDRLSTPGRRSYAHDV